MTYAYRVVVEKDQIYSTRKGKPRHMVLILRGSGAGGIVGIPMRDVTKAEAEKARESIQFAFEFGIREVREVIAQSFLTSRFEVKDGGDCYASDP